METNAFVDAGSTLCVIPVTNTDLNRTGLILEAMAVEGQQLITPAYYELALQNKYLRDDRSVQMLDYIRDGRTVDLGYYNKQFTGDLANLPKSLMDNVNMSFTTAYNSLETATKSMIETAIKDYIQK